MQALSYYSVQVFRFTRNQLGISDLSPASQMFRFIASMKDHSSSRSTIADFQ